MERTRIRKALDWIICVALILIGPVLTLPKVWNDLFLHTHRRDYQLIELPILSTNSKIIHNYSAGTRYGGGQWIKHEIQFFTVADPQSGEPRAVHGPEPLPFAPPRTIPLLFNPNLPGKPSPETSLRFVHADVWPSGWVTGGLILFNLLVATAVVCNLVWNKQQQDLDTRSRASAKSKSP